MDYNPSSPGNHIHNDSIVVLGGGSFTSLKHLEDVKYLTTNNTLNPGSVYIIYWGEELLSAFKMTFTSKVHDTGGTLSTN